MSGRSYDIVLLCWGLISLWLVLSPTSFFNSFSRGRIPLSYRAILMFRLTGILSVVGVSVSLVRDWG
jgi:hypothetical protein